MRIMLDTNILISAIVLNSAHLNDMLGKIMKEHKNIRGIEFTKLYHPNRDSHNIFVK